MAAKSKKQDTNKSVLNDYESVIIITPVLSEEQLKDTVSKYRKMITDDGGELVHEENWGLTKLAYPIDKKSTGFYHIFEFKANNDFLAKFELAFRRDERIMRYLTTALDKHAVLYNQRKRNGEFNQSKKDKNQEGK
jgi:small subunit ribosomal protein S6